jgi:hypothetical protein
MFRKIKRISRRATKAYATADRFLDFLGVDSPQPVALKVPASTKRRKLDWLPFRKPQEPHWREYEKAAVAFLKGLGFSQARGASPGADGGVDVRVPGVLVGQVKAHKAKIGRPKLQQIFGVATAERGVKALFFSKSGYSREGLEWANQNGIILFQIVYKENAFIFSASNKEAQIFMAGRRRRR